MHSNNHLVLTQSLLVYLLFCRTTDSLILTKDKNKQKHAQAEGANSDGRNSPTKGTEGALNGARTGDSVKLTKERSKANLAKEKSRVASVKE